MTSICPLHVTDREACCQTSTCVSQLTVRGGFRRGFPSGSEYEVEELRRRGSCCHSLQWAVQGDMSAGSTACSSGRWNAGDSGAASRGEPLDSVEANEATSVRSMGPINSQVLQSCVFISQVAGNTTPVSMSSRDGMPLERVEHTTKQGSRSVGDGGAEVDSR
jgi:hypothetical protein